MSGKPGRSGTNKGKDKPWAEALNIVVSSKVDGHKRLRRIAEQCVSLAESGDMMAIKEIADRLDGKAHQSTDVQGDLNIVVSWAGAK
jgi:hypothetical protein